MNPVVSLSFFGKPYTSSPALSSPRASISSSALPLRRRKRAVSCFLPGADGRRGLGFGDPDWRKKYEEDFDRRFNLPHLRDLFPDLVPFNSTFSLSRRSLAFVDSPNFTVNDHSSVEQWDEYVSNNDRVLLKVIRYSSSKSSGAECIDPDCTWVEQWVHRAGPRENIYFKPSEVNAAIVTCGGLCPGLNDVIRQIVITLEMYHVERIEGIQFGFRGFSKGVAGIPLSRGVVQNIHLGGGSILGVSRGGPPVGEIVDGLQGRNINMLFVLGGNGTHAGANAIHEECCKRRMKVAIVGVPKTIDNDILLMDKTFGFDTAVEEAQRAIHAAYIEAQSAYHGIGIVKLMGRSSGFIAMHASLASGQVDVCLIPEVSFNLHGPNGLMAHLRHLIETKKYAVVCVAEGAGQNFVKMPNASDAYEHILIGDIGEHIVQETKKYFEEIGVPAAVKYIDPTYMIRAVRANASDGILCTVLAQNAVHAAFAGFSGITIGICNNHYVYLPIPEVISYPKKVNPSSRMWHRCLTSTGQPNFI